MKTPKSRKDSIEKKLKFAVSIIFILYILICLKVMLFKYASIFDIFHGNISKIRSLNVVPFKTISDFYEIAREQGAYLWAFSNIFGNIIIIIPMGFCLPLLIKKINTVKKVLAIIISYSLVIELSQYIFRMGAADIDDLLCNTIGGFLGFLIFKIFKKFNVQRYCLYMITIIGAFVVFTLGFIVAKEQFGGLLGLVNYETEYKGKEYLPDRNADFTGTLYENYGETLYVYEGLISGKTDPAIAYAKTNSFRVNDSTQFFSINYETNGTTTSISYQPISYTDLSLVDGYIKVQVWLDAKNNVSHVVIDNRYSELIKNGQISSSHSDGSPSKQSNNSIKQNENDAVKPTLSPTETPNTLDNINKDTTEEATEEPTKSQKEEILQGYVLKIYDEYFVFEIVSVEYISDLGYISSSTGIEATAYFTKDTTYTVQVIKGGGSDVTTLQGNKSDILEGVRVKMIGNSNGEGFIAKEITISKFE